MKYNFDEVIDRTGTDALKLEALKPRWGRDDLLPLWVADMDFRTPPFIMNAIKERCEKEVLGYTSKPASYYQAIENWLFTRYDWKVSKELISFTPGIVVGLAHVLKCFTQPGDKVLIQSPVYHPFFLVTEHNYREVVRNPLILENGQYKMDLDHFKEAVKGCKLFILCNPHNPGGRVWTKEELEAVAEICYENGTMVISDEIHADLTLKGFTHTPFAKISEKARVNSITFMSPSKAFNMPGLASSYCIIENDEVRKKFRNYLNASEFSEGHIFAFITVAAAYEHGTEWLNQLLDYIQDNIDYVDSYLQKNMPLIKAIRPQASYLIFLDCKELGFNQEELVDFFVDKAHLALNDGSMFGKEGTGFMRMNAGCPRSILEQALTQLQEAYNNKFVG